MRKKELVFALLFSPLLSSLAQAAGDTAFVTTKINSGNPNYPFPQFLEYKGGGKSLAKFNAEGVTHADMEKSMREAYQIMSHRCRYEGETNCGVPYISFNNFVKFGKDNLPGGGTAFCTEGDGYMLLASAIFADQPTFNGLWMWIHDNRLSKVKKYADGTWLRKGYEKDGRLVLQNSEAGSLAGWEADSSTTVGDSYTGSATDGDEDIAMALLIAYKQWGEYMYQNGKPVLDAEGNQISYKQAAKDYITAMVDTVPYYDKNDGLILSDSTTYDGFEGYMTGDIGVDGYVKGGDTWGEETNWRTTQSLFDSKFSKIPALGGGGGITNYVDYSAPSYYTEFAKWLEGDGEGTEWQINQFKRAEASSDWVMGQLYAQGAKVASAGQYSISDDNKVTFTAFSSGEDFRYAWRTILNYIWHGNPTTTWDPSSHTVKSGGNTFESDMAKQHADYLKKPLGRNGDCAMLGASPDPSQPSWFGPAQIVQGYFSDGTKQDASGSNYTLGCSAPAVVASGDLEQIADIYRQCEITWDDAFAKSDYKEECYENSTPKYFHGWFRTLGMLVTSGNLAAPEDMKAEANVKVYMSVDKTFAYKGDEITYGVQVRNYGAKDAESVVVSTPLDPNYSFVSATDGGSYDEASNSVIWKIGSLAGFKSDALAQTIDTLYFTVKVADTLNTRIALTSTVSGDNFDGWTSNEYPNNATYTMERNIVDILKVKPLDITISQSNVSSVKAGDTLCYNLKFENKAKTEWLNGGRDNVRISYGNYLPNGLDEDGEWVNTTFYQYYRFWNDAPEAYINMGNYRISYYMNDSIEGLNSEENPYGYYFDTDNENDVDKYGYYPNNSDAEIQSQTIAKGEDENGVWNQRLIVKFPEALSAPSSHLYANASSAYQIHKGVIGPGLYRTALKPRLITNMKPKVSDDWSYSSDLQGTTLDGATSILTLVSPCWSNNDDLGYEVDNYSRYACSSAVTSTCSNILVEEWDGYTWRRILGNAPVNGQTRDSIVITDTIPAGLTFIGFTDSTSLNCTATYKEAEEGKDYSGIITLKVPTMLAGENGGIGYSCKVNAVANATTVYTNACITDYSNMSNQASLAVAIEGTNSGVTAVSSNAKDLKGKVYSTNGILLGTQTESNDVLKNLPTGVYVVNGQKVVHEKR